MKPANSLFLGQVISVEIQHWGFCEMCKVKILLISRMQLTSQTRCTAVGEALLFPRVCLSCRRCNPDGVMSVCSRIPVETTLWLQSEGISMSQHVINVMQDKPKHGGHCVQ